MGSGNDREEVIGMTEEDDGYEEAITKATKELALVVAKFPPADTSKVEELIMAAGKMQMIIDEKKRRDDGY